MDQPFLRSYGTIKREGEYWVVLTEAHIRLRAKRWFGGAATVIPGGIKVAATDEHARDLEWMAERYALEADHGLAPAARRYDARKARVASVLDGSYEPPRYEMALPPRDYQRKAAALVWTNGGLLLADHLGIGKTVSALTVLSNPACLPAVVVCPVHLQRQWERETARFLPALKVHRIRSGNEYPEGSKLGEACKAADVIVVTYGKLRTWGPRLEARTKTVIFDECQELRRSASEKYTVAHALALSVEYRIGLSGTPVYNYGGEFFCVLDTLCPGRLGTRAEFLAEWCRDGMSSNNDKASITDPEAFGAFCRDNGMMLRRTRAEVGRELPPLNVVTHEIEYDYDALSNVESKATELARLIIDRSEKTAGFDIMRASQDLSMTLRYATGVAKARQVAAFVRMLIEETGEPVMLFGWHREVYEIWREEFADLEPAFYTGTESDAKKAAEAKRFVDGATKLIIVSLRSGAGLDGLQHVCSTVVIGELDWSPGVHEQCVGRAFRDGQTKPVFAYYLLADGGSDPVVADINGLKLRQLDGVRRNQGEHVASTKVDPKHVQKLAADYLARQKGVRK